jgi:L-lactate utilization protein LutB
MSFLLLLEEEKLDEVLNILPKYEDKIKAAEPIFKLEGRRLEEIARTLPQNQASYDQSYQELKALEEWLNNIKEKKIGKFWKKYLEGYQRSLSTRDIQAYIASEKEIVEMNQIIIEVTLLKSNVSSIVEGLKTMNWMISNITKLRVAELQDSIL